MFYIIFRYQFKKIRSAQNNFSVFIVLKKG